MKTKLLSLSAQVELGLSKFSHLLSEQEIADTHEFLRSLKAVNDYSSSIDRRIVNNDAAGGCAFIKITPVKVEPQYVFGTLIKSNFLNEISICSAKFENNEWLPDESNVLFKALMTQHALADASFNTGRHGGSPITYVEFAGENIEQYSPNITMETKYDYRRIKDTQELNKLNSELKNLLAVIQNDETKLTKDIKRSLVDKLTMISRISNPSMDFEMTLVREQLDKDFEHINAQMISSLSGYLQNMAETLKIEHAEKTRATNPFQTYFDTRHNLDRYTGVIKLLQGLKGIAANEEDKKELSSSLNSFTNQSVLKHDKQCAITQGLLSITRPSGSPRFMFGDARSHQHFISLHFAFGFDEVSEYGEHRVADSCNMLQIDMSTCQFMEMLQAGMSESWTKCTLKYLMNKFITGRKLDTDKDHDHMHVDAPELPASSKMIKADVQAAIAMIEGATSSKKAKDEIQRVITKILGETPKALDEKEQALKDYSSVLFTKYQSHNAKKADRLTAIASKNTEIPQDLLSHIKM